MKTNPPLFHLPLLLVMLSHPASHAAVVNVVPGTNNSIINQVTLLIGGSDVVQNSEASGVINQGDSPVYVKSVRITDGGGVNLVHFNTEDAITANVNPQLASIGGVGVFDNGVYTRSKENGLAAYAEAFANTSLDTDLRNFTYHDLLSPGPTTPGTPDLDLLFYRALNIDDYVLVVERWGNSTFDVTALMADGTPYAGANVLRLGGPGGDDGVGYQVHDWNTGYAASTNWNTQAQVLTVVSVKKFFENTATPEAPVYGFRIVNEGEADPKLLGISADTFLNNPVNPKLVPEPSASLMALAAGVFLLGSRRRPRTDRSA
jgi:hypothetical protein